MSPQTPLVLPSARRNPARKRRDARPSARRPPRTQRRWSSGGRSSPKCGLPTRPCIAALPSGRPMSSSSSRRRQAALPPAAAPRQAPLLSLHRTRQPLFACCKPAHKARLQVFLLPQKSVFLAVNDTSQREHSSLSASASDSMLCCTRTTQPARRSFPALLQALQAAAGWPRAWSHATPAGSRSKAPPLPMH